MYVVFNWLFGNFGITANDKERLKKEEEDVKILSEWYSHIYLTKKSKYNEDKIADIINKMIKFIPKEHWDEVEKNKNNDDDQKTDLTLCQVCYCKFDDVCFYKNERF